jgi:hypothetical protein
MREKQQSALAQFLPDGGILLIDGYNVFRNGWQKLSNSVVGVKNKLRKCPVWGAIFLRLCPPFMSALKVRIE